MKIWDERVMGWLDTWGRIGLMNCRVLLTNGLNAAGNQVASFMNSLGAFSASSQLPFFFTPTFSLCFVPRETVHLSHPSLLLNLTPFSLNTIAVWACVSRVDGHHCTPQVLPVLWVKLNPHTILLTQTDEKRKNGKTIKNTLRCNQTLHQNSSRPYPSPSVPPYIWTNVLNEHVASRKTDKFRKKDFQTTHEGDLYGTLERNVQINVHLKLSSFTFEINIIWLFVAYKKKHNIVFSLVFLNLTVISLFCN